MQPKQLIGFLKQKKKKQYIAVCMQYVCSLLTFFCLQLARRGFSIVLISRSQEKLDEVSQAIG